MNALERFSVRLLIFDPETKTYVAEALVARGVPKSDIVLGLQPPDYRKYTEYAEA